MDEKGLTGLKAIRIFVEWYMLITLSKQSDTSLGRASQLLEGFDEYKEIFKDLSGCSTSIPKIHALQHYIQNVREFGTPDNYDTEVTEHQHIADGKIPFQHTNKRNYSPQMVTYVERRMVLEMKEQYLESLEPPTPALNLTLGYSLQSIAKDSPMLVLTAGNRFHIKDLELCIRNFLHNQLYPEGEGNRHRVKKRKLPEINNPTVCMVSDISSHIYISVECTLIYSIHTYRLKFFIHWPSMYLISLTPPP